MLHHPEAYMRPDSTDYLRLADSILRGAFEGATGAPDTLRTPGYPALLALLQLVSGDPRWAALVNIMLDAGTAALIASTAAILAPGPWSWTAGLLYAFEPVVAAHATLILSEAPFNLLMTLALHCLVRAGTAARRNWSMLAGFALACAALTRPIAVYLWMPLGLVLASRWGPRGTKSLLLFVLAATVPTGLWCARNAALHGSFSFTSISGVNFLFYEAAAVKSVAEAIPVAQAADELARDFKREHPDPILNPFEESRLRRAAARGYLLAHPTAAMRAHAASAVKLLAGPGIDLIAEELEPGRPMPGSDLPRGEVRAGGTRALLRERPGLWALLVFTLGSLALGYAAAACGAWRLWRGPSRFGASLILTTAAYLLALSIGGWAYYRFRVPLWLVLCLLASGAAPSPPDRTSS